MKPLPISPFAERKVMLLALLFIFVPTVLLSVLGISAVRSEGVLFERRIRRHYTGMVRTLVRRCMSGIDAGEEEMKKRLSGLDLAPGKDPGRFAAVDSWVARSPVFSRVYLVDSQGMLVHHGPGPKNQDLESFRNHLLVKLQEHLQHRRNPFPDHFFHYERKRPFSYVVWTVGSRPHRGMAVLAHHLERVRRTALEPLLVAAGKEADATIVLLDTAERRALANPPGVDGTLVAEQHLTRFPFWKLSMYIPSPQISKRISDYSSRLYFYAIGICVVVVVFGLGLLFRAVSREVKTARLKSDFVSNVTHELRTPLTSIRMFVETLQLGRVASENERKECLDFIATETRRLTRLIDRVLEFARIERGSKVFHFDEVPIAEVVRGALEVWRSQKREKETELIERIPDGCPVLACDREALSEAVANLLSNAYKYGGERPRIEVSLGWDEKTVRISVADRGIGIPRREHHKIFEKFYRIEDERTRTVEGTGLGLALVRAVVAEHRGRILLASEPGKGSRFTLSLPLRSRSGRYPAQPAQPKGKPPAEAKGAGG